mmetsp:Transcript_44080/g.65387  ORF Transcript_44080/g.65387 Transcript_44080/m.65387 type:complete len:263 (+) Transcript_44080:116-904(+)
MTSDPVVVGQLVDSSNSSQGMILIVDKLGSSRSDISRRDGIYATKDFCRGHAATIREHLSSDIFAYVGVPVQGHEHGRLERELGTFHFFVTGSVYQSDHVVHDVKHHVIKLVIVRNTIDTKQSRILVARVEGAHAVGTLMLSKFLTKAGSGTCTNSRGAIVLAQHGLKEHEGESVLRRPGSTFEGNRNVRLLLIVEPDSNVTARKDCGFRGHSHRSSVCLWQVSKVLGSQIAKFGVIDSSGSSNYHTISCIVRVDVVFKVTL